MCQPRQVVPGAIFRDETLKLQPRGLIAAFLIIQIREQDSSFKPAGQLGAHLEILPHFRETVKAKIQVGFQ